MLSQKELDSVGMKQSMNKKTNVNKAITSYIKIYEEKEQSNILSNSEVEGGYS
jgi:hypothetical protein